jgi:hypothetical protein
VNEDASPEAQPAELAEVIERNRAMLGDFFAKRAVYELQPTVERHADAVVMPSLRVAVLREPAIGVEYGLRDRNARVVDGGAYTAEGEIIRSALHRSGGLRFHMPRPDLAVALEACGPAGDDPVLEGEPHEFSQIHILLVVVSPVQLILCGVESVYVS